VCVCLFMCWLTFDAGMKKTNRVVLTHSQIFTLTAPFFLFQKKNYTHTHTGYIFPALIASLVPFRAYVITYFFDEADLVFLDPMNEAFTPPSSSSSNNNSNKDPDTGAANPLLVAVDPFESGMEDYTDHDDKVLSG
jgi:hypothetical protein